jgi:hypothetical protein
MGRVQAMHEGKRRARGREGAARTLMVSA